MLSVVRPSLTFHIFDFSSETAERNSTKLDRKQDFNVLYQVCVFRADRKTRWPPVLWLAETFSTFPLKPLTEFNETWQEARSQRSLPSCVFRSDRKKKQDDRPGLWLAETFFLLLFWNRWTEFNETWQETRSQYPLQSLCFRVDRKNKKAALASDWLRHFWLLLWNRWTEFNEIWQEARCQRPLQSLCFPGRSEKQDDRPDLWLAETFSTSPLKPLNEIQRNLTESKLSTSSTKFVVVFSRLVNKNGHHGRSFKKVAPCSHVHEMWPFGALVCLGFFFLKIVFFFISRIRVFF